jgi:hypothetical protein
MGVTRALPEAEGVPHRQELGLVRDGINRLLLHLQLLLALLLRFLIGVWPVRPQQGEVGNTQGGGGLDAGGLGHADAPWLRQVCK